MPQHRRIEAEKTNKPTEKSRHNGEKSTRVTEQVNEVIGNLSAGDHRDLLLNARSDAEQAQVALRLQRMYGNAYVQRLFNSRTVQARLSVSQPGDASEQEADRMADVVIRNLDRPVQRQAEEEEEPVQMKAQRQAEEEEEVQTRIQRQEEEEDLQTKVQRQVEEEEEPLQAKIQRQAEEEEEPIQMKAQRQAEEEEEVQTRLSENLESRINAKRGGGQSLSNDTRSAIEPQFGYDFSQVRVHTDAEADILSQQLHAQAFTTGKDIFFKQGKYQPASREGQWLLSHELTHVVQQGGSATLDRPVKRNTNVRNISPQGAGLQSEVIERANTTFEEKRQKLENFVPGQKKGKSRWSYLAGDKPEKESDSESSNKKKVEPPYKSEPLEGMDKVTYDQALAKFKKMKKPRLLGGTSKSVRRLEALKYLNETVESSKKYTSETQMIVNSVMEAYKDVFGEELKEDKADEKLGTGEQEKVSRWAKFKTFITSIFHIKDWIKWIKDFIEFCKNPVEAVAEKAGTVLPGFLSFAQPIADKIAAWTQWLPIVGIVTSIFSLVKSVPNVISKFIEMLALRSTANKGLKGNQSERALTQAAQYGYAKVRRGFWGRVFELAKKAGDLVLSVAKLVIGLVSGGLGAVVIQAIEIASTLVDLAVAAFKKLKGFGKWLLGIRGKARRENAEKIVTAARQGSVEASELILKLGPSGIARGGKLDKIHDWFKYWGEAKKVHDKNMLAEILQDWDKKEIDTLVDGLAEKLKSQ